MIATSPSGIGRAAEIFHALSDRTRLEIVQRLASGERCVCDLTDALDSAQSRLSWHLKVLKDAGIVVDRKQGRWVYYSLNAEAFSQAGAIIARLGKLARERSASACCG